MGHLRRDTPLWGSGPSDVLVSSCPVARWLGLDGEFDIFLSFSATYVITLYYPNPRLSFHFFILFWLLCAFYYCKSLLPTIGRLDPRVPPDSVLLHSTVKLAPPRVKLDQPNYKYKLECTRLAKIIHDARFNRYLTNELSRFVINIHVCRRRVFRSLSTNRPHSPLDGALRSRHLDALEF